MEKIKIKSKEKNAIIESLKAGIVPRIGLQHIQVDRADEIKEMIKPEEETTDKEVTNEDDTITVDGLTSKDYVIICLIASLVIAVVAIVTLVVVNRKKNKINE